MIRKYATLSDQMNEWLDSRGFYRKHTAKDGSCLFRAVAEQVFNTQACHLDVRKNCVKYLRRNRAKFEEFIEGSFDSYLESLENPKEWAGQVEMSAMSLMLKRDFLVFHEIGKPPFQVTDNGCKDKVMLYFSQGSHYDSVYPKDFIMDAGFCQSLVYGLLYKHVFRMGDDVSMAVEKMLHDKDYAKLRKDSATSVDSNSALMLDFKFDLHEPVDGNEDYSEWDEKHLGAEIRRALAQGFPPFPYKVAKALDPDIYRNVEFDVWNEERRDETIFEPGVKCLVRLDKDKPLAYHAHIQEVTPNKGPVTVYIVELGEKQTVPYESLEPLPFKAGWQQQNRIYRPLNSPSYYTTCHANGDDIGLESDKCKGRKKFFKKTKYKGPFNVSDMTVFPIRVPRCPPGLLPRLPPAHQSQFNSSPFMPAIGRGRGIGAGPAPGTSPSVPFHAFTNHNPAAPHVKWTSPSPRNPVPRYSGHRSGDNANQYMPSGNYNPVIYDTGNAINYSDQHQQPPAVQNFSVTGPWIKTIPNEQNGSEESTGLLRGKATPDVEAPAPPPPASRQTSAPSEMAPAYSGIVLLPSPQPTTPPPPHPQPTSTVPKTCADAMPAAVAPHYNSGTEYSSPLPPPLPPPPPPPPPPSPSQPVAIYPCPYACIATGLCLPFDPSSTSPPHPINYSVTKSQDPSGNDLPFQDLTTLRFFFNLGCDYFRATQMPAAAAAGTHVVWNYAGGGMNGGPQLGYAPPHNVASINGYLTPMSSSSSAGADDSVPSNAETSPCLSDADMASSQPQPQPQQLQLQLQHNQPVAAPPIEELYETAYIYSSSPLGFVPGLWTHHQIDYGMPPPAPAPQQPTSTPPVIGGGSSNDYRNGLVINDQGVLSFGPPCQPLQPATSTPVRSRSDSGDSCRSQRDWANGNYSNRASIRPSQQQQQQQQQYMATTTTTTTTTATTMPRSKKSQPPSFQPSFALGHPTAMLSYGPPPQPVPTSLGIYSAAAATSIDQIFAPQSTATATAFYSPPHPSATIVYSPPAHRFSYFPSPPAGQQQQQQH